MSWLYWYLMDTIDLLTLTQLLFEQGLLTNACYLPTQEGVDLCGADCDSRVVEPNHLFICKGAAFKPDFLISALDAGAVAYLAEEDRATELMSAAPGVPALFTDDIRYAMAAASAACWGHPDRKMKVCGITGTKGKTTVAAFLRSILDGDVLGSGTAIIGTLETYDGRERIVSKNTTPEAPDLWRYLAHAQEASLSCVMEVSSQGLKYQRVEGLSLDVAAFLNIGVDHVSPIEHPTFEDYLTSKLKIFEQAKCAVVNLGLDPDHLDEIMGAASTCEKLYTFGMSDAADFWASDIQATGSGMSFVAHTPTWTDTVDLALFGSFNVENALAAIAIASLMDVSKDRIISGLTHAKVVGRMDVCSADNGHLTTIVDYAHNGMAIHAVLKAVRESYPDRYIIAVFGATGGKGAERRFEMPPAAAPFADRLIFTEDDPGPESAADICRQMEEATPEGTSCETILDRSDAIRHAIDLARTSGRDSVVCVLGKGHEARQLRSDGAHPMVADGEFVRTILESL